MPIMVAASSIAPATGAARTTTVLAGAHAADPCAPSPSSRAARAGAHRLRAAVAALHEGAFGDLSWVEERPLAEGARAFQDLHEGKTAAAKVVLRP